MSKPLKFKGPGQWLTQARILQESHDQAPIKRWLTPLARLKRWGDSWQTQPRNDKGEFGSGDSATKAASSSGGGAGGWQTKVGPQDDSAGIKAAQDYAAANIHTHSLTQSEHNSVRDYEGPAYREINSYLRGQPVAQSAAAAVSGEVPRIDSAIGKSVVKQDTTVYRGLGGNFPAKLSAGTTFTDQAFISTSLRQQVALAQHGGGMTAEIHIGAGSHALSMTSSGVNPDDSLKESEVLLDRGSTFRVDSISPSAGSINGAELPPVAHMTYLGTPNLPGSKGVVTRAAVQHMAEQGHEPEKFVWQDGDVVIHSDAERTQTPLDRLKRWGDSWQTQPRNDKGEFGSGGGLDTSNLTGGKAPASLSNEQAEQNLKDVYERAKASGVAASDGKWYSNVHDQIGKAAEKAGVDPQKLAGMVAATSPRMPWNTANGRMPNLEAAVKAAQIAQDHQGQNPADVAKSLEHPGMLRTSLTNAMRIYNGEDPGKVLNQPKTRSFYNNMAFPSHNGDVTVDVHMARAMANQPAMDEKGVKAIVAGSAKNGGGYGWAADRVRAAAAAEGVPAHELQAAVWTQWQAEGHRYE